MNKKHELCLVVTSAFSFNVLYRDQLEYLAKQGLRLTLICGGPADEVSKLRARNVGRVIDLGIVREPHLWFDLLSLFKLFWHFLWNRYTTVLYTTPKALFLGSIAALLTLQTRRVAFFQGRVYENFIGLKRSVYLFLDKITITFSHEALFVSESLMLEFVEEVQSVNLKGIVLGAGSANGVDVKTFSQESIPPNELASLRQDLGIASSDFVAVIVGRINLDKGLTEIIDVITRVHSQNQRCCFLFIGQLENAEVQHQVESLIASGSALYVDFTPNVELYMALADLHVFLSHREGFGNVAIEAAALGVPTIAFDVVGVRDSVAQGISGWRFPFGDTEAVAGKILELAANTTTTGELCNYARPWAVEHFSQAKVWQHYLNYLLG